MPRAFVVGNGPSLAVTNLDLLTNEISFAVNNIHLVFDKGTAWRPTHYVRVEQADQLEISSWLDSMLEMFGTSAQVHCNIWFLKWLERKGYEYPKERVHALNTCAHYQTSYDSEYCPHMWHFPRLCTFGSSVNVAVQMAVQMGYAPIYLVGCDLGYKDGQASHFDPNYENGKEQPARFANLNTLVAHIIAKRSSPVPILNATIGGELEVYSRVDYESLFDVENISHREWEKSFQNAA